MFLITLKILFHKTNINLPESLHIDITITTNDYICTLHIYDDDNHYISILMNYKL